MSTSIIFPAQPEQILKGLGKLWTSFGQEEKQQGKPTVLRACAMTLIVATDEEDRGFESSQVLSELMHEHPSRGIVLSVNEEVENGLEARVIAQCWKPFGKAQQICCEQIEIAANRRNWPNIVPTIIGITVADLPVVLWCRQRAALNPSASEEIRSGFHSLMALANKTVVNSKGEPPASVFPILAEWKAQGRVVADLEWTRLTPWRQPISQIFDNPGRENKFLNFDEIEITYAGKSPSASVLYMAAWLSAPYGARVSFVAENGAVEGLQRVMLRSKSEVIAMERISEDTVDLRSTNGRERKYCLPELGFHTLMNEELAVLGPDPAFDAAFAGAQGLVQI